MESSAEAGADSLRERLLCETVAGRAGLEYAFELCGLDFLRALDRADLLNVGRLDVLSDVTLDELEAVFRERGGAGSGGCRPGSGAFSRGAGGCLWRGRVRRPAAVRAGHAGGVRLPPGEADGRLWNVLKVRIPRRTRLLLPATDALCPKIKQAKKQSVTTRRRAKITLVLRLRAVGRIGRLALPVVTLELCSRVVCRHAVT